MKDAVFYKQTTDYAIETWATYNTSETIVEYNSFLNNDRTALMLPSGYSSARMAAANNYWTTTDTDVISSMIYDKNDDLSSAGYINYSPFLTEPNYDTPVLALGSYYSRLP